MLRISKAIGIGVAALIAMVALSLLGATIAAASFSLLGWWAIAAFAAAVVTTVAVVAYSGGAS